MPVVEAVEQKTEAVLEVVVPVAEGMENLPPMVIQVQQIQAAVAEAAVIPAVARLVTTVAQAAPA
jgi:hypothetical protein